MKKIHIFIRVANPKSVRVCVMWFLTQRGDDQRDQERNKARAKFLAVYLLMSGLTHMQIPSHMCVLLPNKLSIQELMLSAK